MSLKTEILGNQTKLIAAQEEYKKESQERQPRFSQLPDGFYNPQQLERYQKSDQIITQTTAEFMGELGLDRYRLDREFVITHPNAPRFLGGPLNDMYYSLQFDSSNPTDDTLATMLYGQRMTDRASLRITRKSIPLLVPHKYKSREDFVTKELVGWLNDPKATDFRYLLPGIYEVSEENVIDLLTLIVSGPKFRGLIPED